MRLSPSGVAAGLLLCACDVLAINININDVQSIKDASKTIAQSVVQTYHSSQDGTGFEGVFGRPYFWWESGLAWDSMINYWALTNDSAYNNLVSQALLAQIGQNKNFAPANQTKELANDDQSTWALAAMTAAESGFQAPPASAGVKSWLALAESVFNEQTLRWDSERCGGGLRWQIFSFNQGYNYKNSLSNGNFMQLAARLARYTGNQTYFDWAQKVSAWSLSIGIESSQGLVYDGTSIPLCDSVNRELFTAAAGTYLNAYGYLANSSHPSNSTNIASHVFGKVNATFATTPNAPADGIITEITCAGTHSCTTDMLAYRAILARALGATRELIPSLYEPITSLIQTSAQAAAEQCSGGSTGTTCGSAWGKTKWDGTQGLGQDLSALEIILAALPRGQGDNSNSTIGAAAQNGAASSTGSAVASSTGSATASGSGSSPSASHTGKANGAGRLTMSTVGLLVALGLMVVLYG